MEGRERVEVDEGARSRQEVVAGSVGGAAGVITGHPFDTIKVRAQLCTTAESLPKIVLALYREQGLRGFYRGMTAPLATDSCVSALIFSSYYAASVLFFQKDPQASPLSASEALCCGVAAGVPGSISNCVIELIKIKLQAPGSPYTGPFQAVASIYRGEGVRGLFRGLTPTLVPGPPPPPPPLSAPRGPHRRGP